MTEKNFKTLTEETKSHLKTRLCPTCQGRGKQTRWRYHALCHRNQAGKITLFRSEKSLLTLLENALKQEDFHFEDYNLDTMPNSAPRCNGIIYFDSYTIPCPDCHGSGKHSEEL